MSRTITKSEYVTLASFRFSLRKFLHFSEAAARAVGLTPRQYQALLAIMGMSVGESLTIGDLAEQLLIRHHSAVGLVDRLAAQGLVRREPSTTDRRQVVVSLTRKGAEVLEGLAATHRDELRRIGPELDQLLRRIL